MNKKGAFLFFLSILLAFILIMGVSLLFLPKQDAITQNDVGKSSVGLLEVKTNYEEYVLEERINYENIINEILNKDIDLEDFTKEINERIKKYEIEISNDKKLKIKLTSKEEKKFSKNNVNYERKIVLKYEYKAFKKDLFK